jgi:hypothetical protein
LGTPRDLAMLALIPGQIAPFDCLRQRNGLAKRKAKSRARDGIYRPRGVTDQRNAAAINGPELAR